MGNQKQYKGENFDTIEGAWDWHSRAVPETVYGPEELEYLLGEQIMFKKDFEEATTKLLSNLQPATNDYAVKESQWISVEDDILPPFETKQLIIVEDGTIYTGYYEGADTYGDRWFCDDNDYHYPTHWQPLPSPPKSI